MPSFEKNLPSSQGAALSDAQFTKIVELLTPGFELSTLMLADYKAQQEAAAAKAAKKKPAADTTDADAGKDGD